jgi:hypothetical protein
MASRARRPEHVPASGCEAIRLRIASVIRDYGLNERAEAPDDNCGFHEGGG